MCRLGWVLLASTCILGAQATLLAAASPTIIADGAKVRAALARRDLPGANEAFNTLVEARLPPRQVDRPDPLLDSLLVEQLVVGGIQPPLAIVQRLARDQASPNYIHNVLLSATAEESSGDEEHAQAHYSEAARSTRATADQRLSATLGLARLKLAVDPVAAAVMLGSIDMATVPAARRWEIDLERSRALAGASPGDPQAGAAERLKAWAEAPDGGMADHAVARVANDLAVAAGRGGDRETLITLLAVDRSNRGANRGASEMAADLPICGENGVLPDDVAIVEAQRSAAPERPGIELLWASRPGIGQFFLRAARRSGQLAVSEGADSSFVLRCRSTPSPEYVAAVKFDDFVIGWMTSKGAYPITSADAQNVTQLAATLADRTSRFGKNSIMRLPVLLRLMACVFPQVQADEQARARINDLVLQISAVLDSNGAPPDIKLLWRMASLGTLLATRAKTPEQAQVDLRSLLVSAAADPAASRDFLYNLAAGLAKQPGAPSAFKEAVLTATLKLFDREPATDPRARALALQLYILRANNGDVAGAEAALAGRNLAQDLCVLASPLPHFVSSNIRSDDYPSDLIYAGMIGVTPSEFDLDVTGRALNGRILVSDPPYVFDDVTRQGIATVRYDPPLRAGKARSCRGFTQSVRWQLPY